MTRRRGRRQPNLDPGPHTILRSPRSKQPQCCTPGILRNNTVRGNPWRMDTSPGPRLFKLRRQSYEPHYMEAMHDGIFTSYKPIAHALREEWPGCELNIIPLVMSRTGTPHKSTVKGRITKPMRACRSNKPEHSNPSGGHCALLKHVDMYAVQWLHRPFQVYKIKHRLHTRITHGHMNKRNGKRKIVTGTTTKPPPRHPKGPGTGWRGGGGGWGQGRHEYGNISENKVLALRVLHNMHYSLIGPYPP